MSQTEQLLQSAQEIARRTFEQPSDDAVMAVFHRLCLEADELRFEASTVTLH